MKNKRRKIADVGEAWGKKKERDLAEWQPKLAFEGREADVHPGRLYPSKR